jgi:hypothetical protein
MGLQGLGHESMLKYVGLEGWRRKRTTKHVGLEGLGRKSTMAVYMSKSGNLARDNFMHDTCAFPGSWIHHVFTRQNKDFDNIVRTRNNNDLRSVWPWPIKTDKNNNNNNNMLNSGAENS